MRKPRWWGRAQHAGLRKKAVDAALGILYSGGWPAVVTRALGLQGTLAVDAHEFAIPRRSGAPPMRVTFAADFHLGPTLHRNLMTELFAAIADSDPELLLLGGDFVSFHARFARRLVEPLRRVRAPLGKIAVLGNHDLLADDGYVAACLTEAGVRVLVNENVRLPAPHDDVWVCGLDDWDEGDPRREPTFRGAEGTRILLMHQPDGLSVVGDERFDIAFCGHVHGGQYLRRNREPAIRHKGPISKLYMHGGIFRTGVQGAPVLVSRGIGTSTLPVRRHADPQIHLCRLSPAK